MLLPVAATGPRPMPDPLVDEERVEAAEVGLGRVEVVHDLDVAVAQLFAADLERDDVRAELGLVGRVEPALGGEPVVERRLGDRVRASPIIESAIRASVMNSRWASKIVASSLSKPMIIPHQTSIPASWIRWTFSRIVPPARTFWNFLVSRSDSSLGLSMPMNTAMMLASTISSISSASSARSIDASVKKVSG